MERSQAEESSQADAASAIADLLDPAWTPFDEAGWGFELRKNPHRYIPRQGIYDIPDALRDRVLAEIAEYEATPMDQGNWSFRLGGPDVAPETSREAAAARSTSWFRSNHQTVPGGVEVALARNGIALRDGKNPTGTHLSFAWNEWADFLKGVRNGEFSPQAA